MIVGRFGRVHGVKGFISVHSFTEPRDNILNYSPWHVFLSKQWQPVESLDIKVNNKSIVVLVKGYEQRELASRLTNMEIAVRKGSLPKLEAGEYYWHDLLDMQVINHEGKTLGKVTKIMPTGANDVLIVTGEKRHLIPYLPEKVILAVHASEQWIEVDWDPDF